MFEGTVTELKEYYYEMRWIHSGDSSISAKMNQYVGVKKNN